MQFEIANKHLQNLYEKGRSRKYKLPPHIIEKFIKCVLHIESATSVYDFWNTASYRFEKLKGFESRYSMRLNRSYRVEMEIEWEDNGETIGVVYIVDVNNHYGN